ncbi:hypothetical protein FPV67DRAFT_1499112 [Lyophyllum atratum]|nr:hypothetical protein FPV67DRAFT_1499112 [Lyophyllum atratum]
MAKGKGRRGVSRVVHHVRASPSVIAGERARRLGAQGLEREREESRSRYHRNIIGLSTASRTTLEGLAPSENDSHPADGDSDNWENVAMDIVGSDILGEGGEGGTGGGEGSTADMIYDLRDIVTSRWKSRWYTDHRTWKARRQNLRENWAPLMNSLADAYLTWRKKSVTPDIPSPSTDHVFSGEYDFTIQVIDIYGLASSVTVPRSADSLSPAVALVEAGYLSSTPNAPTLAISLQTLELFRVIRLHRASFSVEAFAKVICHFYSQPYRRRYRTGLSDAFDIYLAIRRIIDQRVAQFLEMDSPNYRVLNACPACNYEVEGEPVLRFRRMWVHDGNNSLKRCAGIGDREVSDTRLFESSSDYYLPRDYVDQYAHEVKARRINASHAHDDEDQVDEGIDDGEADPTDGDHDSPPSGCTENWKAAAADEKKKMWAVFEESGIFASACRHGFILWITDMVRSGELAKYPLAMVAKALEVLGDRQLSGYDIGCEFEKTVTNSSLGRQFKQQECRCCVNAFHGYSHNYLCQIHNHPNCIEGMGIEDLETMERVFSSSNSLASLTRYMSAYRRQIFIDLFFRQWDAIKYENLANMLHQNYIQSLKIIETNTVDVEQVLQLKNLTEDDIRAFIDDERIFFQSLGKEPEDDLHAIAYVELLDELRAIEVKLDDASSRFRLQTPHDYSFVSPELSYANGLSETRRADTARRHLTESRDKIHLEVMQLEDRMNIVTRWTPTSPEYQKTAQYIANRRYERALDNLQRLVIKRLFELHKLNLSQTGYRMRSHIAKSLQSRSKTIRTAVKQYNTCAAPLGRPTLDWSKVSHYSFLDEFNLLRDTRNNVQEKPWADPVTRETMRKYQRLQRAKEEIIRCNVEIRRLHTSIVDELHAFNSIMESLMDGLNPLSGEISDFIRRRQQVNENLLARISQTHALRGFTGDPSPGVRKGSTPATPPITHPSQAGSDLDHDDPRPSKKSKPNDPADDLDDEEDDAAEMFDDETLGDLGGLVEFFTSLSTS